MNHPHNFKVSVIINNQRFWWQEGCMGRYWGKGNHKEVLPWIEQGKGYRAYHGTLVDLCIISLGEELVLHLHDTETEVEFAVIKPNWQSRLRLLFSGITPSRVAKVTQNPKFFWFPRFHRR